MALNIRLYARPYLVDNYLYLTSAPYPLIFIEGVGSSSELVDIAAIQQPSDDIATSSRLTGIALLETIAYRTHNHFPAEDELTTSSELTGIVLFTTIAYLTHNHYPAEDELTTSSELTGIALVVVIAYLTHNHFPAADALTTSSQLTGISLA